MKLNKLHSVYFLGIGGIGMSAIARWFHHLGVPVFGYDRTSTPLTRLLEEEGMGVNYEDKAELIPAVVKENRTNTMVVWTPAVPQNSDQLTYFIEGGFDLRKRSEVLGLITDSLYTVAVAGTHGKTTTSSMIAHLLKSAGKNMTAFLGGVSQNYGSNFILGEGSAGEKAVAVVEADEFDRSFLRLKPDVAIVTSVAPDHLDIYGDPEQMVEGFREFIQLIDGKGHLYIQTSALEKLGKAAVERVSSTVYDMEGAEIHSGSIKASPGAFEFDYISLTNTIRELVLKVPGFHNVENALAAIAVALRLGLTEEEVRSGLLDYKGVKRRFEIHHQEEDRVYIDDYAHHPDEIRACLQSVRAMYPNNKLTVIFQPHLYSRTRDFAPDFSRSLSIADEVVLLDIYPARELPIEGVNAEMLLEDVSAAKKSVQKRERLISYLEASPPEVLVTMGAGDIDRIVSSIANWMKSYGR